MNLRPLVSIVSKPVAPPWNDSAKNIVAAQIANRTDFDYRIMTVKGAMTPATGIILDPLYKNTGKLSGGIKQNLKVMLRGLRPRGAKIYHYFFAPNKLSSYAGRVQKTIARVKTVQTICSAPKSYKNIKKLIFSDMVIALSEDTLQKLVSNGINPSRVKLIRPGITQIKKIDELKKHEIKKSFELDPDSPIVMFCGDYEFSSGFSTVIKAAPLISNEVKDVKFVFACREKTPESKIMRDSAAKELDALNLTKSIIFTGEVRNMPELVQVADLILMPAKNLYAKMDAPLVVLEAMSAGVPVVLSDIPVMKEIIKDGGGATVQPDDPKALASKVADLLNDDKTMKIMGEKAQVTVKNKFDAKKMSREIEKLYKEIL